MTVEPPRLKGRPLTCGRYGWERSNGPKLGSWP